MLVLAFDTSTPAVTVAVVNADREICADRVAIEANRHGELLAPMIRDVLAEADVQPSDLAAIGVGLGPGPFTGLRVGIVTAKAMSDALGVPAYGECSLDLIADQHGYDDGPFAVLSDSRRKQVYWALYDADGVRIDGPELGRPDEVADLLRDRTASVAGAGALLYRDAFAGFEIAEFGQYPGAIDLGWRVADRAFVGAPSEDLTPMYLRRPDAAPPGRPKQVTPA
jgi:tRNA threonylcarbamoyl adenosine modification protein YeaZ